MFMRLTALLSFAILLAGCQPKVGYSVGTDLGPLQPGETRHLVGTDLGPVQPGQTKLQIKLPPEKWIRSQIGSNYFYTCRALACAHKVTLVLATFPIARNAHPKALANLATSEITGKPGKATLISGPRPLMALGYHATIYSLSLTEHGTSNYAERMIIASGGLGIAITAMSVNAGEAKRAIEEFLANTTVEDGGPRPQTN